MNSKQFITLFFTLAVAYTAEAIFFGGAGTGATIVTFNNAATLPLLSATAGTLATPLAVLGVLKLGLAAIVALGLLGGGKDEEEYYHEEVSTGYGHRHRRSANNPVGVAAPNPDAVFALIASMDSYGCGKQLVCELEAKAGTGRALAADEALLLKLFSKNLKTNQASPKAEYDMAAELGMASKSQLVCRNRYVACPYTSDEMMAALRQSHI